MLLISHQQV